MADFDAIYEEEEEHEENIEENYVAMVPDPVVVRGAGNMTVWVYATNKYVDTFTVGIVHKHRK